MNPQNYFFIEQLLSPGWDCFFFIYWFIFPKPIEMPFFLSHTPFLVPRRGLSNGRKKLFPTRPRCGPAAGMHNGVNGVEGAEGAPEVWRPSAALLERAALSRFRRRVNETFGVTLGERRDTISEKLIFLCKNVCTIFFRAEKSEDGSRTHGA